MRFEATPNPNAVKCVLDESRAGPIVSAGCVEEAGGDPQALALLAVPGVTRVLMHAAFITVCKESGAEWAAVKRGVKKVLDG